MVSKSSKNGPDGPVSDRAEQRAQALRDNLRRRKGQARARRDADEDDGRPAAESGGDKQDQRPKV